MERGGENVHYHLADTPRRRGFGLFLLSPLDERRLQQQAGKCNSSGQTLIFSLSFPPTQHFVDIVVLILSFLEWMEESEAWKCSKEERWERHGNDKAQPLKAEPNALLKG